MMNEIQLYGEINAEMANDLREQLNEIPTDQALLVKLASPGGLVGEGVKMYNWLRRYKSVEVEMEGDCFSAATLITSAGDHVNMSSSALMMIHEPYVYTAGNAKELKKTAQALEKLERNVRKIYHSKTRLAEGTLSRMMADETYLDAEEALSRGFVDAIAGDASCMFKPDEYEPHVHDKLKLAQMMRGRPGFDPAAQDAGRAIIRKVLNVSKTRSNQAASGAVA